MERLKTKDIEIYYNCVFYENYVKVNFFDDDLQLIGHKNYYTLDAIRDDLVGNLPNMSIEKLAEFFGWQDFDDYFLVLGDFCNRVLKNKDIELAKRVVKKFVATIEKNGKIFVI